MTSGRRRAVFGAAFSALFIFTFLCIFAPGAVGIVGRGIKTGLTWAFGTGRFAVPPVFLGAALFAIRGKPEMRIGFLIIGSCIIALSLLAIVNISVPASKMFTAHELESGGGGGIVGAVLAWPLSRLIGKIGAYVFLFAALFAGIVLAFEEQLAAITGRLKNRRSERLPAERATDGREPAMNIGEATLQQSKPLKKKSGAKVYPSAPMPAPIIREELDGQLAMKVQGKKGVYRLPPATILNKSGPKAFSKKTNEERKKAIEKTLESLDVDAHVTKVSKGPTVSLFEVEVGTGEKVRRVTELEQDIAYALGSPDIRIYSPIPGRQAIGIEVPNHVRDTVMLGDFIDRLGPPATHNMLTMAVGKDMSGDPVILDLAQLPHLLLAGSTGAGKSSCINCLVSCLLIRCRPDQVKLIMIDPKYVEFTHYNGLPHLLCPVINEPGPAAMALQWAVEEMDRRYQELQGQKVVHIDEYNAIAENDSELETMPKIVIVIDELADLMAVARREVETSIARLTSKARAVGIHMIIATQRPSVDVITGVIKNNITARIAFQVASHTDSRTILSTKGAEKLLGKGDMLLDPGNIPLPERVQGALIQHKEIEFLTGYIREQKVLPSQTIDLKGTGVTSVESALERDVLIYEAAQFVVFAGEASASMLQTRLRVGYARARRLVFELEELGLVGPHEGSRSRKVLIKPDEYDSWMSRQS